MLNELKTLKEQAIEDGYVLDESSYNNFHKFLEKFPRLVRADLVLLENGELVAIWNGENGTEVGLQFQKTRVFNIFYSTEFTRIVRIRYCMEWVDMKRQ